MILLASGKDKAQFRAVLIHLKFTYYSVVIALARLLIHCETDDLPIFGTGEVMLGYDARAILEFTNLIDLKAALAIMPLAAMLIVFDLVIQDPTSQDANTNLLFLDMASGYFSRLEQVTDAAMQTSRLSEFAQIARDYRRSEILKLQTDQSDPPGFPAHHVASLLLGQSTISRANLVGSETNAGLPPRRDTAGIQSLRGVQAREEGISGIDEGSVPTAVPGGALSYLPMISGPFSFEDLFRSGAILNTPWLRHCRRYWTPSNASADNRLRSSV